VTRSSRLRIVALAAVVALAPLLAALPATAAPAAPADATHNPSDRAVFFTSDGLRQDLVRRYAAQGVMPTMRDLLRKGVSASGNGLLTQAPPNTGAGWYTLATGAWPAVHGSTNNTFHVNGQPFANRTGSFDPGVLQAESIAQSAERGGLKVAQVEWAGGRNATINGPTIDFQSFFSGRGVATNFIGHAGDALFDDAAFIAAFGL
jgi:Type I phosphodiesterase / nucleotide pyrophosphatase